MTSPFLRALSRARQPRTRRGLRVALVAGVATTLLGVALPTAGTTASPTLPVSAATEPSVPVGFDGRIDSLWIGDSYTAGQGASDRQRDRFSCMVSRAFDWRCHVDAVSGTGFLRGHPPSRGSDFMRLIDRLDHTWRTYRADVVILDAGRNDRNYNTPQMREAVTTYVRKIREFYPNAKLAIMVPYYLRSDVPNTTFESIVAALPDADQICVIDPFRLGWVGPGFDADSYLAKDGRHPNDRGHAYLAERTITALTRCGLDELRPSATA